MSDHDLKASATLAEEEVEVVALGTRDDDVPQPVAIEIAGGHTIGSLAVSERERRAGHLREPARAVAEKYRHAKILRVAHVAVVGNHDEIEISVPVEVIDGHSPRRGARGNG